MRLALAWVCLLSGCTVEPTQLVVAVHTDMDIPGQLDAFSVSVDEPADHPLSITGGGRARYGVPLTLAAPTDLPATFGVSPRDGDASRSVTVRATAYASGAPLFETRATTSFVDGEQLRLDLFLAARCVTETCPAGFTCGRLGCADPNVPASTLPDWTGRVPEIPGDDAGVPGGAGWPRIAGWSDEVGSDVTVTDAVTREGVVFLVGTVLGHAWIEGDPAGPTEVDAPTQRAWVICLGADGSVCGLELLGSDQGEILEPRIVRDTQGRLLLAATFTGQPSIDDFELDAGPAGRAAFVVRTDPSTGAEELGILETPGGLALSAIAVLDSDAVLLSLVLEESLVEVTRFDGSPWEQDLSMTGGVTLVLDPALRYLGATLQPGADASSPSAAAASGAEGRTAVATAGTFFIQHFREGEVNPWSGVYINSADCSAMAAAAGGDGKATGIACSTTGPVLVGGVLHESQRSDVWIGLWDDPAPDFPRQEVAFGGPGDEVVLDAAVDAVGTLYFVGRYAGQIDIDASHADGADDPDAFLWAMHLDNDDAIVDRLDVFRSSGPDDATAVAVNPVIGVVVAGRLGAPTEIDGQPLGVEGATAQVWVHRFLP